MKKLAYLCLGVVGLPAGVACLALHVLSDIALDVLFAVEKRLRPAGVR